MLPALFVDGQVFTGTHHGDAFTKLSESQKNQPLASGWFDPENKKFHDDANNTFYLKTIFLVRHANPANPNQIFKSLPSLPYDPSYILLSSPIQRCLSTAVAISDSLHISLTVCHNLIEQTTETNQEFTQRIHNLLDELPDKCIVVSHSDVINVVTKILGNEINRIPNCAVIKIHNQMVNYL